MCITDRRNVRNEYSHVYHGQRETEINILVCITDRGTKRNCDKDIYMCLTNRPLVAIVEPIRIWILCNMCVSRKDPIIIIRNVQYKCSNVYHGQRVRGTEGDNEIIIKGWLMVDVLDTIYSLVYWYKHKHSIWTN
jgi:hypothetical protein